MAVRYRSTACDAEARALVATTGALVPQRSVHCTKPLAPQRSAFRPLLSHKAAQGAGSSVPAAVSHAKHRYYGAAWGAGRRHCQGEEALTL